MVEMVLDTDIGSDVDDLLAAAQRIIPPHVASVTQAGLNYIEICPPNVDKGTGLAVVAEAVGQSA